MLHGNCVYGDIQPIKTPTTTCFNFVTAQRYASVVFAAIFLSVRPSFVFLMCGLFATARLYLFLFYLFKTICAYMYDSRQQQ